MFVTWLFKRFCVPCCTVLVLRRRVSAWQVAGCALVLATTTASYDSIHHGHFTVGTTMAIMWLDYLW